MAIIYGWHNLKPTLQIEFFDSLLICPRVLYSDICGVYFLYSFRNYVINGTSSFIVKIAKCMSGHRCEKRMCYIDMNEIVI